MVFGYYHITLRTLNREIFPELGNINNGTIKEKVKVGHILWIPFFPMGKVWVLEQQGNMYSLNPAAASMINAKLGKSKTPWYTFFGLIAIPVLFALMNISSSIEQKASASRHKANFEKTLTTYLDKVDNPKQSDLFFFKDQKYKQVALKVVYSTTDSVYFLSPQDNSNKKWNRKNWAAGYYLNDNPTREVALAKADLKKSFRQTYQENMRNKGMLAGALPLTGLVQLEKVETIKEDQKIPVISEAAIEKVKSDFLHFIEHSNKLDSLVALIDKKSHAYYNDKLTASIMNDKQIVNQLQRQGTKNPNCQYELMLYTKYVYLPSSELVTKKATSISVEEKKNYLFFLKLLEKGFLTLSNDHIKQVEVTDVSIPQKDVARLSLKLPSNMLKIQKPIHFSVEMRKEGHRWKMNLPSTYSYTEHQISGPMSHNTAMNHEWRKMVRANMAKMDNKKAVAAVWNY